MPSAALQQEAPANAGGVTWRRQFADAIRDSLELHQITQFVAVLMPHAVCLKVVRQPSDVPTTEAGRWDISYVVLTKFTNDELILAVRALKRYNLRCANTAMLSDFLRGIPDV